MIQLTQYEDDQFDAWDELCSRSPNSTFLQTRRYLTHHDERFVDRSLLVFIKGKLAAVLPAGESLEDSQTVVSHPGLTYGGLITDGSIGAPLIALVMPEIFSLFRALGYRNFIYKPVPRVYQRRASEDDEFVIAQMGAVLSRVQLNCIVDLNLPLNFSSRKKRNLKKAASLELVQDDPALLPDFHKILESNLMKRHGVSPVHTLGEMQFLLNSFPDEFGLYCAIHKSDLIGGAVVFRTANCWHAQYIAMTDQGAEFGAVDFTLAAAMKHARMKGAPYFSLGVSNDPETGRLNDSLYGFKREFGGGGLIQSTWTINL